MEDMEDMKSSREYTVELDMLFLLGIFFTIIGALVIAGWFFGGSLLNLYGVGMLVAGIILVVWRPKPPRTFFLGRAKPEEVRPSMVRCVCGRMLRPDEFHIHGYDPQKGYYIEESHGEDHP